METDLIFNRGLELPHFAAFVLLDDDGGRWALRSYFRGRRRVARPFHGLRANASAKSHAELDESEELDEGNPTELAARYRELARTLQNVTIVGGCCGTDHRHIAAVAAAWPR